MDARPDHKSGGGSITDYIAIQPASVICGGRINVWMTKERIHLIGGRSFQSKNAKKVATFFYRFRSQRRHKRRKRRVGSPLSLYYTDPILLRRWAKSMGMDLCKIFSGCPNRNALLRQTSSLFFRDRRTHPGVKPQIQWAGHVQGKRLFEMR